MMNELIDSRAFRSDPIVNGLFVNKARARSAIVRSRVAPTKPHRLAHAPLTPPR